MVTLRVRQVEHDGGGSRLRALVALTALGIAVSLILCPGCQDFGSGRTREETHPAEAREAPGRTAHAPHPDASTEVANEKREAGEREGATEESGYLVDLDGHILSTYREGYVLSTYTVVRGFCCQKWGSPCPSKQFLFAGKKPVVDKNLGKWAFQGVAGPPPHVLEDLGQGMEGHCFGGKEHLYRDAQGIRLIVEEYISVDTLILTARHKAPAKLVDQDLGSIRTASGLGLGDSEARVLEVLAKPSQRDTFGGYEILWYLEKPQHVVHSLPGEDYEYDEGHAAAYALENRELVEIWLHLWTTEAPGG